jgi:hypothetical protein
LAAAAVGAAGAVGFVLGFGAKHIGESLANARRYGYKNEPESGRIAAVLRAQARQLAPWILGVAALLALPFLRWRARAIPPWLVFAGSSLILLLLYRFASPARFPTMATPALLAGGALLPLALGALPDRPLRRELGLTIGLPAGVGAIALAFSSTNGFFAAVLALFPAAVAGVLGLGVLARDRQCSRAALCALIPLTGFQGASLLERNYRDAPFSPGAVATFASGPFAGIVTGEANAQRLARMRADLNGLGGGARTLFVYDDYPAAYLLSPLRPRTFSTWVFWPHDPGLAAQLAGRVFAAGEPPPDIVLQVHPASPRLDAESQRRDYRIEIARPELGYVILRRDRSSRSSP